METIYEDEKPKMEEKPNEIVTKQVEDTLKEIVKKELNNVIENATDLVYDELKEKIEKIGVKKSTLTLIIKYVMEAVENTPKKGKEQKDYALQLIRDLVIDLAKGDDKDFLLIAIDSGSVSDTIDLIVSATKGELNINKVVTVASRSCVPAIFACIMKK